MNDEQEIREVQAEEVMGPPAQLTQAEAEAHIREIKRWCRGLPVLNAEQRNSYFNQYKEAEAKRDWNAALTITLATEKAATIQGLDIEEGDWEKLNGRFHIAVFAHGDQVGKPCGSDFNDIICSGPLDGKQHSYKCPRCGQEGFYGAPYITSLISE